MPIDLSSLLHGRLERRRQQLEQPANPSAPNVTLERVASFERLVSGQQPLSDTALARLTRTPSQELNSRALQTVQRGGQQYARMGAAGRLARARGSESTSGAAAEERRVDLMGDVHRIRSQHGAVRAQMDASDPVIQAREEMFSQFRQAQQQNPFMGAADRLARVREEDAVQRLIQMYPGATAEDVKPLLARANGDEAQTGALVSELLWERAKAISIADQQHRAGQAEPDAGALADAMDAMAVTHVEALSRTNSIHSDEHSASPLEGFFGENNRPPAVHRRCQAGADCGICLEPIDKADDLPQPCSNQACPSQFHRSCLAEYFSTVVGSARCLWPGGGPMGGAGTVVPKCSALGAVSGSPRALGGAGCLTVCWWLTALVRQRC